MNNLKNFIVIFSIFVFLNSFTGCALLNKIKEKLPFFKKQEIPIVQPQPTSQVPQEIKETPEQKIKKWKEELKANPNSLKARFNLASAYSEKGDIALALFEFQEIIRIAPKSEEAKESKEWIKKQSEEAKVAWQNTVGKKVQEAVQIAQYTSITPSLKTVTERVERGRIPTMPTTPLTSYQPVTAQQPTATYILITIPQQTSPK